MERAEGQPKWRMTLAALAVMVAAIAPFWGALASDFVLDDVALVRDNPLLRDATQIPRLFRENYWAPHDRLNLYRPLTMATLALNRALSGPGARGFHAGNLALHALVSALLLAVALRLGAGLLGALAAALLFATHPLHTEPIVEVIGRSELLAAAFALTAIWGHANSRTIVTNLVTAVSVLAGLLAKEIAIGVLPALLALDVASGRLSLRARGRDYALYALAVAIYAGLRWRALGVAQIVSTTALAKLDNPLVGESLATRLMTAAALLGRYLGLTLWPGTLSADYSYAAMPRSESWLTLAGVGGALAVIVLAWIGLRAWRRGNAPVATAVALFLGSYFVVSNAAVLIGTIFAERLFYLPSAGLALLLATSLTRSRGLATVALGGAVALSLAFGVRAATRTSDFKDERTLLAKTITTSPASVRARIFYAYTLLREGNVEGARAQVHAAMAIDPELGITWVAAARVLGTRDIPGATNALRRALELDPTIIEARVSLAAIYVYTGRPQLAIPELERVRERHPTNVDARISLAEAYLGLGQDAAAAAEVGYLVANRPDLAMSHFLDGRVHATAGNREAAIAAYRRGLAIQPDHVHASEALRQLTGP